MTTPVTGAISSFGQLGSATSADAADQGRTPAAALAFSTGLSAVDSFLPSVCVIDEKPWLPFPSRVKRMRSANASANTRATPPVGGDDNQVLAEEPELRNTFAEDIQGTNLVVWASSPKRRSCVPLLMERIPFFDKNALDFAGKWPLALSAFACGMSPTLCFIDSAQSGGAAGVEDGMFATEGGTVKFEVRAAHGASLEVRNTSGSQLVCTWELAVGPHLRPTRVNIGSTGEERVRARGVTADFRF